MLRIHCSESAQACAKYFDNHLETGDYYFEDQENEKGTWFGKAAEKIGIEGQVTPEQFHRLIFNKHPLTNERLNPRNNAKRRPGYDFEFSVCKGLSLVYLIGEQEEIRMAFQDAVRHTMGEIEREAKSRFRDHGEDRDVVTGNLVWSEFIHKTARPVDGLCDPQLHCHAYVHNTTFREDKGRFMALQAGDLKRDAGYFQAIYFERLADNLKAYGYQVEATKLGPDIIGIPQELKDKFSRRTQQIEKRAKEWGITKADQKAELGALTRENKKTQKLTFSAQKQEWRSRLGGHELKMIEQAKANSQLHKIPIVSRQDAMQLALDHCFERESVVSHRKLIATAQRFGKGQVKLADLEQVQPLGLISKEYKGQKLCTLDSILSKEAEMLSLIRKGKHAFRALNEDYRGFTNVQLNEGQRGAIQHLLASNDRVSIISGKAGVGKTTLMKELKIAAGSQGKEIFAYAPTAHASRTVLREDGFKDANTVASLLHTKDDRFLENGIILIDECGLLGVDDMVGVLRLAEKRNCRVVLSGDRSQHQAVSGSPAMAVIEKSGLVKPFHVTEIVRQQGVYKQAVADIANGQYDKALDSFQESGWIMEGADVSLHAAIANDYVKSHHLKDPNLVIAPTHSEGVSVTASIRERLKKEGRIGGYERKYHVLKNYEFTKAEKTLKEAYHKGQIIEFNQPHAGFSRGQQVTVLEGQHGSVRVRTKHLEIKSLPLTDTSRFDVYNRESLGLVKGDLVRITDNTKDLKGFSLNRGDRLKVIGFTASGDIKLEGGKVMSRSFNHYAHGYTNTSFAAQGKSPTVVQIVMNNAVKGAINKAQFYVSASRGKLKAKIYTNDITDLRQWIRKPSEKMAAHDLVGYPKLEQEQMIQQDHKRRVFHVLFHGFGQGKQKAFDAAYKGTALLKPYLGRATYKDWGLTRNNIREQLKPTVRPIDWCPPQTTVIPRNWYDNIKQYQNKRSGYER